MTYELKNLLRKTPQTIWAFCALFLLASPLVFAQTEEPISYIGHGGFFDSNGRQISLTFEFIDQAQSWYRAKILSTLKADKRDEFLKVERKLSQVKADGQSRLVVQQHLLNWLISNSSILGDGQTLGKFRALKYALNWKIPYAVDAAQFKYGEAFKIDIELEKILKLKEFNPNKIVLFSITQNSGQRYIDECRAAGVPIPPPIGQMDPAGLNGWKSQGFIPTSAQFIVNTPAEVRTYESLSPRGMCIALPRYTGSSLSTVQLDGVICLGETTSKVCFWDNQMTGPNGLITFSFSSGTKVPIGVPDLAINPAGQYQGGGVEIENGAGGQCSNCHAGENPYIIHPQANLGNGVQMGSLVDSSGGVLQTFSTTRYDPLVGASWWQNQLSHSVALVPPACAACHQLGSSGGAFPHLSSELNPTYCRSVLAQAIARTMPPSAPGSLANDPAVVAFQNWCSSPATSGPSNRGDPHITTANSVNYDFQAAGEFTALKNSATKFELQTRQTPVATTLIPGPNPYTGLSSCVSLNTAAAVRIGKSRITYQPTGKLLTSDEPVLRINGKPTTLPPSGLNLGGSKISKSTENGIDIRLSDGTRLMITPYFWSSEGYWYLNIEVVNTPAREGTMGHILTSNWLPLAPDGSSFGPAPVNLLDRHYLLNQKFADAWRVKKNTSLFDYEQGTSTQDFTDNSWPPEPGNKCIPSNSNRAPVNPMNAAQAEKLCRFVYEKTNDKQIFNNCVFDLTVMGDKGIIKAYLQTLKLRAKALSEIKN